MSAKIEFRLVGEGLPADVVTTSYELLEQLSSPYQALITFSTRDPAFKPSSLLRVALTLEVVDADRGRSRTLSGICDQCEFVHHEGVHFSFRARLVPPIAAMAHREDCRIYQEKSPVDVVKELLAAAGVEKVEWQLSIDYPTREYIVQYRESELDFMHRLLEDSGIFYFFKHEAGEATMVLADSTTAISEELAAPVILSMSQGLGGTDPLSELEITRSISTSSVLLRDYDFEKPQSFPESAQPAESVYPQPVYEYPGGFKLAADGQRRVDARLRELRRETEVGRGKSSASNLEVGKMIAIIGAAQEIANKNFVIAELRGSGKQSLGGDGGSDEGGNQVENRFTVLPEGAPFSPPRRTPKPRIYGVQTAMVTGPTMGEEEIHTDKYGRVKVRFRWDRVGQYDDQASCWLRVAQSPLGGQVIIPRVGWEVMVGFFEGDPDKPYILGRLYNAERTPPYALPGAKTSGSIKGSSSPGGAGHNEIKMGDSGGGQGFDVSAQKDLNVVVGHDQNETVGVDDATNVKVNASHSVGANQSVSVGADQEVNVGSVASANVTGNLSVVVGGNAVDNAISNYVEKVGADRFYSVGGDMLVICNSIKHGVTADVSRTVGAVMLSGTISSISDTIGGNYSEDIGIAKVDLCKASFGETISGNKNVTSAAAELHISKADYSSNAGGMTTNLVGGLHYSKIAGDLSIKAPMITLLGAVGLFKGGSAELKLGGGPITVKGSKVVMETALLVHLGASLKLGD